MRQRLLVAALLLLASCGPSLAPERISSPTPPATEDMVATDPDYSTCAYVYPPEGGHDVELVLPDPHCTPGAYDPAVTVERACAKEPPRPDLSGLKLTLLVRYGQAKNRSAARSIASSYELDHFGPRWMGGLDTELNLWPEPQHSTPNRKDAVEFRLHDLVCRGLYSAGTSRQQQLEQARQDILQDWVALWLKFARPQIKAGEAVG